MKDFKVTRSITEVTWIRAETRDDAFVLAKAINEDRVQGYEPWIQPNEPVLLSVGEEDE